MKLDDVMKLSIYLNSFEEKTGCFAIINIDDDGMHIRVTNYKEHIDKSSYIPAAIMKYINIEASSLIIEILNSLIKESEKDDANF